MTDTPLTDAQAILIDSTDPRDAVVPAWFARDIERRLWKLTKGNQPNDHQSISPAPEQKP